MVQLPSVASRSLCSNIASQPPRPRHVPVPAFGRTPVLLRCHTITPSSAVRSRLHASASRRRETRAEGLFVEAYVRFDVAGISRDRRSSQSGQRSRFEWRWQTGPHLARHRWKRGRLVHGRCGWEFLSEFEAPRGRLVRVACREYVMSRRSSETRHGSAG